MAPSPPGSQSGDESAAGADARRPPAPRWTKILGGLGIALLLVIIAVALWNLAIGNRWLIAGAVAATTGFAAWRGWHLLRHGKAPADSPGGPPPPVPRWVKVSGIIAIALVLLAVGVMALAPGEHGPGRHGLGQTGPGQHSPSTSAAGSEGGTSDDGANSPVAEGAAEIALTAEKLAFNPETITVRIGTNVAIVLTSVDARHDFRIDEFGARAVAEQGETTKGGFHAAPPGQYAFYCAVPGHREAGMEGTLIVTGGHG